MAKPVDAQGSKVEREGRRRTERVPERLCRAGAAAAISPPLRLDSRALS
jgi:hypothetical protein